MSAMTKNVQRTALESTLQNEKKDEFIDRYGTKKCGERVDEN